MLKYSLTLARNPSLLVTVAPPASTRMKSPRSVRFTSLTIIHVDQTGAADAQHGLRAQRQLRLLQGAARVVVVPARPG